MKMYKWEWYVVFSRREERDVAQGVGGWSQGVHLTYSIVRAGQKNSMFTKIKHSCFVADFFWS